MTDRVKVRMKITDKLLAIAPSSPRPRSATFRPRVQVRFPTGGPEGSEPARALLSVSKPLQGTGKRRSHRPGRPSAWGPGHSRQQAAPHAPSPPGSRTITTERRAPPGTSASAGPTAGHAQCGSEPRPRQPVRVAACSPAPRGT